MNEKASCITINCGCCRNGNTPSGGTGAENVYSTEETVCGTWIDGKPIYRKVIVGTTQADDGSACVFADVANLSISRLINLSGNMIDNKGESQITLQISFNRPGAINGAINMWYESKLKKIYYHFLNNYSLFSNCEVYVVLEYTKS